MKGATACLILFLSFSLTGCSTQPSLPELVYHSLYSREKIVHPGDDPVPPSTPSYDAYQKEREKILNKEPNKQP